MSYKVVALIFCFTVVLGAYSLEKYTRTKGNYLPSSIFLTIKILPILSRQIENMLNVIEKYFERGDNL